ERVRSPLVTAVATSAIARTWLVRFAASRFTLPVRSFQVPAAPGTLAWPPSRPSTPTSRATLVTCSANVASVSVTLLIVSASAPTSPLRSCGELLSRVAVGGRGRDFDGAAHLVGQVRGEEIDGGGEVLPGARHAGDVGLPTELALGADLARHPRHLGRERAQLIDHRV